MTTPVAQSIAGEAVQAAADQLAGADAEQLPLFEVPSRASDGDGNARLQAAIGAAAARAAAVRAGPGRPKGSANRSTVELRNYLLSRGIHPLENLMRWAMHTPESLALELSCSRLEAFDRLKAIWAELAPYFTPRLQPTGEDGKPVPFLQFFLGAGGGALGGDRPPWEYLEGEATAAPEMAEISHSGEPVDGQSHDAQSHEAENAQKA